MSVFFRDVVADAVSLQGLSYRGRILDGNLLEADEHDGDRVFQGRRDFRHDVSCFFALVIAM